MGFKPKSMKVAKITVSRNNSREILKKIISNAQIEIIDVANELGIEVSEEKFLRSEQRRCIKISEEYTEYLHKISALNLDFGNNRREYDKKSLIEVNDIAFELLKKVKPTFSLLEKIEGLEKDQKKLVIIKSAIELLDQMGISNVEDLGEGKYFDAMIGYITSKHMHRITWNLDQLTSGNYIFTSVNDGDLDLCLIGVSSSYRNALERLLQSIGFSKIKIPNELKGSPNVVLDELKLEIKEKEEEISKLKSELSNNWLNELLDIIAMGEQIELENQRIRLLLKGRVTENQIKLWFWVPEREIKHIASLFDADQRDFAIEFLDPNLSPEEYPTFIENNKYSKPFEDLVHGFGTPGYKEIDPTKILSILIPIFFGIMFADLLDGFVVLLLGIYGLSLNPKKYSKSGMLAELQAYFDKGAPILCYLGISAMIFGILFGSYRGLAGAHALEMGLPILWFSPEVEGGQFALLELAIVLGALTIAIALIIQFISIWGHNKKEAIFVPGMLFVFYFGLIFLLFTFGPNPTLWFSETNGVFDFKSLQTIAQSQEEYFILNHDHYHVDFHSFIGNIFLATGIVNWGIPVFAIGPFSYPFVLLVSSLILTTGYHFKLGMDGISEWLDYLITLISNTISFARIFAYTMVHGSLSLVFIQITDQFLGTPFIGMFLGAFIVIPLELLVSFLQSLRLNWVEFFGKMHYLGTGHKFDPIKEVRKYTKLRI